MGAYNWTGYPVRYSDGVTRVAAADLVSGGFGLAWGVGRTWANTPAARGDGLFGNGWMTRTMPVLRSANGGGLVEYADNGAAGLYFDLAGGVYTPRYRYKGTLTATPAAGTLTLTDPRGNALTFWDFDPARPAAQRGRFVRRVGADGVTLQVTGWTADGLPADTQRSAVVGGGFLTESLLLTFAPTGPGGTPQAATATLRRRLDAAAGGTGAWATVRSAEYTYHAAGDAHGRAGDLKRVVVRDAAGAAVDTSYYRYYLPGAAAGYDGGLKLAFGPAAYARLAAAVGDVDAATDAQAAPFADHRFEFDDRFRVTREVAAGAGCSACAGGQGEFTFEYSASANAAGPNSWRTKTAVTLPDGNREAVYSDADGRQMLKTYTEVATGDTWRWFTRTTPPAARCCGPPRRPSPGSTRPPPRW